MLFRSVQKQTAARDEQFQVELKKYVDKERARANGPVLCLMDSMDHTAPATEVARYLRLIKQAYPEMAAKHSTLPAFFDEARARVHDAPVRRGELREPSKNHSNYLWLIPYCVSARVRMKQANDACQTLLERWVEPLMALANHDAEKIPHRFLQVAWKHLLTNHAHDSICGCSIDQVHRDMMYRFDQTHVLGSQLMHQSVAILTSDCKELASEKDEFTIVVVNPLPQQRDDVVTFDIDFPLKFPTKFKEGFHSQHVCSFTLEDESGQTVPYQRLSFTPSTNERSHLARYCFMGNGPFARYRVAAQVKLPAMGYNALRVCPSKVPVRAWGTLRTGPTAAENSRLAIAIEPNGTLTLTDKTTQQTYTQLLTFEDRSEIGDGWFHGHSLNDEQILSSASTAQISDRKSTRLNSSHSSVSRMPSSA